MKEQTILFETIFSAQKAYDTLQLMIDVGLDCNAVTYDYADTEVVRWLIQDNYCLSHDKAIYFYPKPESILLVDDDPNLLLILGDYLEYMGLKATTAESIEAAWQFYHKVKPSVIISGIAMQSINCGYRLFQQVREQDSHQPFIFLSGQLNTNSKKEDALRLGADACFGKPFEPEELLAAIEKLLRSQITNFY